MGVNGGGVRLAASSLTPRFAWGLRGHVDDHVPSAPLFASRKPKKAASPAVALEKDRVDRNAC